MLHAAELNALWLSLQVAACATLALLGPATACAWLLARREFPGKTLVEGLLHLPLILPPVVTGYLLLMLLGRKGLLGSFLAERLDLVLAFNFAAAVIAAAVMAFPLMLRPIRMAMELVPSDLEQAARSLGLGPWRSFFRVTLPLALPGFVTGALLAFARSLGEFGATITFAGNIAGETQTLPLAIFGELQVPGGERSAIPLVACAVLLSLGALLAGHFLNARVLAYVGGEAAPPWARLTARLAPALARLRPEADPTPQAESHSLDIDIHGSKGRFRFDMQCRIEPGITGVFGPSGHGKSLLLKSIAGLEPETQGRLRLGARPLLDSETALRLPPERRPIGMVFQDGRLFPQLSVEENLRFAYHPGANPPHLRFARVVEILGLEPLLARRTARLSGGERRRVALGRSLLANPAWLLLDEPLTGLDLASRIDILDHLKQIARHCRIPILIVSHELHEILSLTDRLLCIRDGRIVANGPIDQLQTDPALEPLLGAWRPLNLLRLRVAWHDEQWTYCHPQPAPEGPASHLAPPRRLPVLRTPRVAHPPGHALRYALRPDDIILSLSPLAASSMQNQLAARPRRIFRSAGRSYCELDAGFPLTAELPADLATHLERHPHHPLWCLFRSDALN